jgi:hypothetical protein
MLSGVHFVGGPIFETVCSGVFFVIFKALIFSHVGNHQAQATDSTMGLQMPLLTVLEAG